MAFNLPELSSVRMISCSFLNRGSLVNKCEATSITQSNWWNRKWLWNIAWSNTYMDSKDSELEFYSNEVRGSSRLNSWPKYLLNVDLEGDYGGKIWKRKTYRQMDNYIDQTIWDRMERSGNNCFHAQEISCVLGNPCFTDSECFYLFLVHDISCFYPWTRCEQ